MSALLVFLAQLLPLIMGTVWMAGWELCLCAAVFKGENEAHINLVLYGSCPLDLTTFLYQC